MQIWTYKMNMVNKMQMTVSFYEIKIQLSSG